MVEQSVLKNLENINIVAIGGGTGSSTILRGLKKYTQNLTAIITVADDGGGSGMIREDLNFLPPGDIRNCILALSQTEELMDKLFRYRFTGGRLKGQSFGNLFLAAMCGICNGSFEEAVQRVSDILMVKGKVLPVSNQNINLGARLKDGSVVLGESSIPHMVEKKRSPIERIFLTPQKAEPLPDCIESIKNADVIILGPGSLYTSIIPNLLVDKISDAIYFSRAKKIYICNIMTQRGETEGHTAYDHVNAINTHAGRNIVDMCFVNNQPLSEHMLCKYKIEKSVPVVIDETNFIQNNIKLYKSNLLDDSSGFARHNFDVLAKTVLETVGALA